ncbi:hypothetical protein GPLA_1763 [Paraglaciecola polaris LMG 21857]|uniref:Uncharacterized protein n=1 Tax=Paraglaciecola polaris LMG 21857 TaxID=1129793 RepID=K6ZV52_9ALTE|nr:hypothetical protein GPLA_1763 [Paraglaciecola polaris LMG 21857]
MKQAQVNHRLLGQAIANCIDRVLINIAHLNKVKASINISEKQDSQ